MIREDKFVLSHGQYAVDLDSLKVSPDGDDYAFARIRAVWFRRRKGVTIACVGVLWDGQRPIPANAAQFLAQHDDGRYGGDCKGRWDGARYWGSQDPDEITRHLELLRPMLAGYPECPDGYQGWWRF